MAGREIPIRPDFRGKVRDIYDLGDALLMVASDRVSAFDYVLDDEIPFKGEILTKSSLFWFEMLEGIIGNHVISADVNDLPERFKPYGDYLGGRFMLVKKAEMLPVECIVRGYLAGTALLEYESCGSVCSIPLPVGLSVSSRLPEPLFTPSTKAPVGAHDENVSFEYVRDLVGDTRAELLRDTSLAIFDRASSHLGQRGLILADTKFEFGIVDGELILADEVLTPDCSRLWLEDSYEPGKSQPSFDKQIVRDWLDANWDRTGQPPHLPADVIENVSDKYIQAYELISGKAFTPESG